MKKIIIAFLAIVTLAAPGCNGGNSKATYDQGSSTESAPDITKIAEPGQDNATPTEIERKIIKSATLRFKTNDINKTRKAVDAAIKQLGGYISSENNSNMDYMQEQYLEIKVPAQLLDSFINVISLTAESWETKSISSTDVTEEYIDVSARLNTKKELESRYLELLKRAGNVQDMLSVEAELATVRGEIESMEGRIKFLNSQVSYSSVNLSYYVVSRGPVGFFGRIGDGFVDGWRSLLEFLIGLIKGWPFVIMLGGLAWWIIKRGRQRRASK